jgi:hypothetical protein
MFEEMLTTPDETKRCPFCDEEIRVRAVICKHCHQWMPGYTYESAIRDLVIEKQVTQTTLTTIQQDKRSRLEQLQLVKKWAAAGRVAPLRGFDLSAQNLRGIDLAGADLRGSDLREADLSQANLEGANLSKTNMFRASLEGSNLQKAKLPQAYMREVNLTGANLTGASLKEAICGGPRWMTPPSFGWIWTVPASKPPRCAGPICAIVT